MGSGQFVDYVIDSNLIARHRRSTATLTWYRHVGRTDGGTIGVIDAGDSFFVSQTVSDLDLQILRNGTLVAESTSDVDNVEHLFWSIDQAAQYTLRVRGMNVYGGSEAFALAWYGAAVPEPATWTLGLAAIVAVGAGRRRFCRTIDSSRPTKCLTAQVAIT